MTTDVFEGYVAELAATEARQMLDRISAVHPTKELISALQRVAAGPPDDEGDAPAAERTSTGRSMFRFNGADVALVELRDTLSGLDGFSVN